MKNFIIFLILAAINVAAYAKPHCQGCLSFGVIAREGDMPGEKSKHGGCRAVGVRHHRLH